MAEPPPVPPKPDERAEPPGPPARETIVLVAVLIEGGLACLAVALGWLFRLSPLHNFAWISLDGVWGLLAALPMVGVFFALNYLPLPPLARIRRFGEQVVRPILSSCTVVDLLGISILAGLGEEMLFRGLLQGAAEGWFSSKITALVVAASVFGLMHAITLTYMLLATLAGVYLGWVWLETGNLLTVIVAHALYDFAVLLWLMRGPGSAQAEITDEAAPEHSSDGENTPADG